MVLIMTNKTEELMSSIEANDNATQQDLGSETTTMAVTMASNSTMSSNSTTILSNTTMSSNVTLATTTTTKAPTTTSGAGQTAIKLFAACLLPALAAFIIV